MLPPEDVAAIQRFCDQRVSAEMTDRMRLEAIVSASAVTIVERCPPWQGDSEEWSSTGIARLRFTGTTGKWTLYSLAHDGRWRGHERIGSTARVQPLLEEIDRDPTCIFWG